MSDSKQIINLHQEHCSLEEASLATEDYTCPVCACKVSDCEEQHVCENCSTPHHKDCWDYAGGCAIFGCRKGLVRHQSSALSDPRDLPPVSLSVMSLCSMLFKVHWLAFLTVSYGTVISAFSFISLSLAHIILRIFRSLIPSGLVWNHFLRVWGFSLNEFFRSGVAYNALFYGLGIVTFGAAVYMLFLIASILIRIHFGRVNLAISSADSQLARNLADRIDMPRAITWAMALNHFVTRLANFFIAFSMGTTLLSLVFSRGEPLFAFVMMLVCVLIRFLLLPLFNHTLEVRSTMIATLQNRLIASAKKQKS